LNSTMRLVFWYNILEEGNILFISEIRNATMTFKLTSNNNVNKS